VNLANVANRLASFFSYDAIESSGRRKAITRQPTREDALLTGSKRRKLQETAADLSRNLSLAAWMVRRHLDYVSQFEFHGRHEDDRLNDKVERLMWEDSRPSQCDVAGRFNREKMFRVAEARRVLDNDTFLVKLRDGRLQGLQGDLIRDPAGEGRTSEIVDGVRLGRYGRHLSYAAHKRESNNKVVFAKWLAARNVIHYGFFDRYSNDQVRGVSPISSALNPLRDVYENFDYALAKAKVSQLFAISFYRNAEDGIGYGEEDEAGPLGDEDGDGEDEPQGYKVSFADGPIQLDLDPGDRAEFLESKQPSSEFQDFTKLVIQVALKALDLPYSFYDESATNFFGSRAAWLHYERSCKDKRDDQIELRRNYTVWKMQGWIKSGRLTLPRGMTIADYDFEWVPIGMPWFDPLKEINGTLQAIKGGLDNPQRACRSTGSDFYDNVDAIAKATQYAEAKGVSLEFAVVNSAIAEAQSKDQPEDEE